VRLRVALGQASTSERKEENLKRGVELISEASKRGADILILPELFMAYLPLSEPAETYLSVAEPVQGVFTQVLAAEARRKQLFVAVGILEKNPDGRKVHNTVVLIGPDGKVLSKHRKLQLFDSFGFRESDRITPGEAFEGAFQTGLGKMGMMTCFELRFPELARMLALEGAELIIVPTAWVSGRLKEDHLITLARARAIENTVFVAVACQTGRIFTGRSMVVDPFGVVLCDGGDEEGLVVTDIDLTRINRVREYLPTLELLRRDAISKFWKT